jgi:hypothetical protein
MWLVDAIISALPDRFRRRVQRRNELADWLEQVSREWRR